MNPGDQDMMASHTDLQGAMSMIEAIAETAGIGLMPKETSIRGIQLIEITTIGVLLNIPKKTMPEEEIHHNISNITSRATHENREIQTILGQNQGQEVEEKVSANVLGSEMNSVAEVNLTKSKIIKVKMQDLAGIEIAINQRKGIMEVNLVRVDLQVTITRVTNEISKKELIEDRDKTIKEGAVHLVASKIDQIESVVRIIEEATRTATQGVLQVSDPEGLQSEDLASQPREKRTRRIIER